MKNKNTLKGLISLIFFVILQFNYAQNLEEETIKLSDILNEVEGAKNQYAQSLNTISNGYNNYELSIIDKKGNAKKATYEFSFSDIDINTVRTISKKDLIQIQLLVKGKQPLIKKTDNTNEKVSFENELEFYAENIDNGRELVAVIKSIIPLSIEAENNKLSLNGYTEHVKWLEENVNDVAYSKNQRSQKLTSENEKLATAKLVSVLNTSSKAINSEMEFNFSLLNPNSLKFKVKGEYFNVECSTRRGIKSIKVRENGEQENYEGTLRFYSNNIENAKDIYKVLKQIIPLAEDVFKTGMPNVKDSNNAIEFINDVFKDISGDDVAYVQNINGFCVSKLNQDKTTDKGSESGEYDFNFADLNVDKIDYDTSKTYVFVELFCKQKQKLIKFVEDGELQNYKNEIRVYFNTIEDAMVAKIAFQNLIGACQAEEKNKRDNPIDKTVSDLISLVKTVSIGDDSYDQSIEEISSEENVLKYTNIHGTEKKSTENVFEFGLKDINPESIVMKTSGKHVLVMLTTKHFEKIIKTYVNGEIKSYVNKIEIEAEGIENARALVNSLRQLTE